MTSADDRRQFIADLVERRDAAEAAARQILERATAAGATKKQVRRRLNFQEATATAAALTQQVELETRGDAYESARERVDGLTRRIADENEELARMGEGSESLDRVRRATANSVAAGRDWARRAAHAVMSAGGESRAVVSGSFDVPRLVEPNVAALPHPARLIDLLINRQALEQSASFEFFQQIARTTNATAVADGVEKPVSTYTVTPVVDRARVVAHLSQPAPLRLWQDAPSITDWLWAEMVQGTLNALENQAMSGSGSGENMKGLLTYAAGSTPIVGYQAWSTDIVTTLRSALTQLQELGEVPTGWVLNPVDAQKIDLLRASTAGPFLSDGYDSPERGVGNSSNIFGQVPRVVSNSVPAGTAVLADWTALKLYVREEVRVDIDVAGELFRKNQFQLRAELRAGIGLLRPSAFCVVETEA